MPSRSFLAVLLCLLLAPPSARADWEDVTTSVRSRAIPGRGQHGFTCTMDGTLYVFGGAHEVYESKSTRFEFLGDFWRQAPGDTFVDLTARTQCPIPPTIEPHLASDAEGRVYEFGGIQNDLLGWFSNRLYRFDPATESWEDLTPADSSLSPPGREDHGFAGDWKRDALWVFGGVTQEDTLLNDLWCYDVPHGAWERVTPASSSPVPAPRELYDLVWDGCDALYLFGGWNAANGYLNDFWTFDIPSRTWTDRTTASASQAITGRSYVGLAMDPNGILWLAGGYDSPLALDGFWRYDTRGGQWSRPATSDSLFLPRATYEMVYRPTDRSLYLFGGLVTPSVLSNLYRNDVWRYPLDPTARDASIAGTQNTAETGWAHLTVAATGVSGRPLRYRWYVDESLVPELNRSSANIGPLCPGQYELRAVVRDGVFADTVVWSAAVHGPGAPGDHVRTLAAQPADRSAEVRWSLGGDGRASAFHVYLRDETTGAPWALAAQVGAGEQFAGPGGACTYGAHVDSLTPAHLYTARVAAVVDGHESDDDVVSFRASAAPAAGVPSLAVTVLPRTGTLSGRIARITGAAGAPLRLHVIDAAGRVHETLRVDPSADAVREVPLPPAAPGVYWLSVSGVGAASSTRFVVP